MKPSGLIRKSFDSITVKIIALMVLFILPLNIGLIMTSMRAAEAVRHQTTLSLQHVVRRAMQQLDNQIFSTNYFLFDLDERNPYFIRLQEREMDNAYMLAKACVEHIAQGQGGHQHDDRRDARQGDKPCLLPTVGAINDGSLIIGWVDAG